MKNHTPLQRSVLFRRIILLLLSAVLLSGLLSAGIYIFVAQRMYADMRAEELMPIARTIAEMLTETSPGYSPKPIFDRGNNDFGASMHIFDTAGNTLMNQPDYRVALSGRRPETMPADLADEDTLMMLAPDLKSVLSGSEVSEIRKSPSGESFLVVGVPIKIGEEIVGAVIFTKALSELNATMNGLNVTLIISTLVAFIIMLIPGYFMTRRIVVPIRQMRDVAQAMAKGDFTVRADESEKGELGELGLSMNHFAAESERLEQTRRDYVANVSHELRTPIAAVRAMGETLRDGMAKTDEKRDLFYNNIVRESLRLSRLVDDLLELSRLQAGTEAIKKQHFDLREVIRNISDVYSHVAAEAGVDFIADTEAEEPAPVFSNADRVEQVLVVLMDNAIKHTPQGGTVSLSYGYGEADGGKMQVAVSNTGEGIPDEDIPHIFERFYKVDKSHSGSGTGLGLSIAKEITKGLNEEIRAESIGGRTSFTFTIAADNRE
jgi:signal transduction histidine kinase